MRSRPSRAGGRTARKWITTALTYGLAGLCCAWAGYCFHAIAGRTGTNSVEFAVTEAESAAAGGGGGTATVEEATEGAVAMSAATPVPQPPWDPLGCQTIVFFHVPKTGGESLNELWVDMPRHERISWWKKGYRGTSLRVTGLTPEEQKDFLKSMKPWERAAPLKRHKVVEIHCGDAMSFMQAGEVLDEMRADHEENYCGFFAFTMIRQPLDWIVSLYDDICHRRLRGHKDTCPQKADMTPKEEMLAFPHRNGIVSYLAHGFKGWDSPGPVDDQTVEDVAASLRSRLDLVALTQDVPRLRRYLTKRFVAPNGTLSLEVEAALERESLQNANNAKIIRVDDFDPAELEQLNSTVQLDWKLYAAVLDDPPWQVDLGPS